MNVEQALWREDGGWADAPEHPLGAHLVLVFGSRQALSRRVGADVTLEVSVDPGLIGGVVARIGDLLLDGSVRTQLENLGASLRKGSA